ncbi:probable G-protein coupled receptor No18, partial [Actinia tenebrosa]|uniref:Probable G-protein coupled receptor No18 n=1 Tax=Actinia tenebrosa TaxID=6105 RepID=A0A6P8IY26_ACTTE
FAESYLLVRWISCHWRECCESWFTNVFSLKTVMFYEGYYFEGSLASTVFYMIVAVFTVVGNSLVFITFVKDPYGQLRKRRNYFLVNLAVSDIIMGACAEPLLACGYWYKKDQIFFAHYLFAIISGASSLTSLTALTIIRYYALKDPFEYEMLISSKRVLAGVVLIWLQSGHLALLPVLGWQTPSYQLYLYGVGFSIPCIFIFLAYFGILRSIRHYTKNVMKVNATIDSRSSSAFYLSTEAIENQGQVSRPENNGVRTRRAVEREKNVTKTLLIVMCIFVLSWLPMLIVDVLMVQCVSCRNWENIHLARDVTLTITYFSSGVNPILYTLRMRQFRAAVIKLLGLGDWVIVMPYKRNQQNS